jgi:hypothetical protein
VNQAIGFVFIGLNGKSLRHSGRILEEIFSELLGKEPFGEMCLLVIGKGTEASGQQILISILILGIWESHQNPK